MRGKQDTLSSVPEQPEFLLSHSDGEVMFSLDTDKESWEQPFGYWFPVSKPYIDS